MGLRISLLPYLFVDVNEAMPIALTVTEQKEYAVKLQEHLTVVMNAPCAYFDGYPFLAEAKGDQQYFNGVYIQAVIERFDEDVQNKLMTRLNHMLHAGNNVDSNFHFKMQAIPLNRVEGGFQLIADDGLAEEHFMADCLGMSPVSNLWAKYETYDAFANQCQIRFSQNKQFGSTTARVVRFKAYEALPLYVMLWLVRELEWCESPTRQWMGEVQVIETNGLPDAHDWICWHSSLITWFETPV
jgi:hypothetical protein